jgi:DNA-binding transcriptional LysR family regulator
MIGFVREGLGVTVVPELSVPDDPVGIALVPITPAARRRVVLARSAAVERTPRVKAFTADVCRPPSASSSTFEAP